MALKACKECGKEISTTAQVCPHCGKKKSSLGCGGIIVVLFIIAIIAGIIGTQQSEEKKTNEMSVENTRRVALTPEQRKQEDAEAAREGKLSAASALCYSTLTASLHDPGSAKLDAMSGWHTKEQKDGTIRVQPSGRAKNAFGAYVYGVWDCVVREQNKTYVVTKLKQIRP
jgi:RNA polymerase subunit RPABC4/transcription elongation factor Spt4